jgi:hypothetical protein
LVRNVYAGLIQPMLHEEKRSEGLGRESIRPPGPDLAQNAMSRPSMMDGHTRSSVQQNQSCDRLPS